MAAAQVFVMPDTGEFFNPHKRLPSFSMSVPEPRNFHSAKDFLAELKRTKPWMKDYMCSYYGRFGDKAFWTPLGLSQPVRPAGPLCIRAVFVVPQVVHRIALVYVHQDAALNKEPDATLPLSASSNLADLRDELICQMPDLHNYHCKFYVRQKGAQSLVPVKDARALNTVVYVKAVLQSLPWVPEPPAPKQEVPSLYARLLRQVNFGSNRQTVNYQRLPMDLERLNIRREPIVA